MIETRLFGILNYTPDSFSDGNKNNSLDAVLKHYHELIADQADYVDIGAQATNYNSIQMSPMEEWAKLEPLLKEIGNLDKVSIDTYNHTTAKNVIDLGVKFINDVSGGKSDEMLQLIAKNQHVKYICMFSLTIPADKTIRVKNTQAVYKWCDNTLTRLTKAGIAPEQIVLDPGIGFTTTPEQSFEIIQDVHKLQKSGARIMIGHSRKSFLEELTSLPPAERDVESTIASIYMYGKVDYLRVHNVNMHKRAFRVWKKLNESN